MYVHDNGRQYNLALLLHKMLITCTQKIMNWDKKQYNPYYNIIPLFKEDILNNVDNQTVSKTSIMAQINI